MDKQLAFDVQQYGLNAIIELSRILETTDGNCTNDEFEVIKRGVGLSIGRIQMELLEPLYLQYPEIDPLIEKE